MGLPIIPGTSYVGEDCEHWLPSVITPYLILMTFTGIELGQVGEPFGRPCPNGTYVGIQMPDNPCGWWWDDDSEPAGPSDVYGCDNLPESDARAASFGCNENLVELYLQGKGHEFAFYAAWENDGVYAHNSQLNWGGEYYYNGAGAVFAINMMDEGFSVLSIADLMGITGIDRMRAEVYPVGNGSAGCRFSRKIDSSRIYIRTDGS